MASGVVASILGNSLSTASRGCLDGDETAREKCPRALVTAVVVHGIVLKSAENRSSFKDEFA